MSQACWPTNIVQYVCHTELYLAVNRNKRLCRPPKNGIKKYALSQSPTGLKWNWDNHRLFCLQCCCCPVLVLYRSKTNILYCGCFGNFSWYYLIMGHVPVGMWIMGRAVQIMDFSICWQFWKIILKNALDWQKTEIFFKKFQFNFKHF